MTSLMVVKDKTWLANAIKDSWQLTFSNIDKKVLNYQVIHDKICKMTKKTCANCENVKNVQKLQTWSAHCDHWQLIWPMQIRLQLDWPTAIKDKTWLAHAIKDIWLFDKTDKILDIVIKSSQIIHDKNKFELDIKLFY